MGERINSRDPVIGKWEVYRCNCSPDKCGIPWMASYEPSNAEYHDWMSQGFPTHTEAIAYADSQARQTTTNGDKK